MASTSIYSAIKRLIANALKPWGMRFELYADRHLGCSAAGLVSERFDHTVGTKTQRDLTTRWLTTSPWSMSIFVRVLSYGSTINWNRFPLHCGNPVNDMIYFSGFSTARHYLNWWCITVSQAIRNICQWNVSLTKEISIQKIDLMITSTKMLTSLFRAQYVDKHPLREE